MKILSIPCSYDNYSYLIICESTGKAAIVDPAEYYPVSQALHQEGVSLQAIYCTHHHADHIGGLADLIDEFPGLPVYGHENDKKRIAGMNHILMDGSRILIGDLQGETFHTPGHTTGSICFLVEDALFTGDTLFGSGCGRLFEGTAEQLYNGLNNKIKPLSRQTKVYFGHEYTVHNLKFAETVEPDNQEIGKRLQLTAAQRDRGEPTTPSTLQTECATNPFLRCTERGIIDALTEKGTLDAPDPLSVFTALRRLRDNF